MDTCVGISRTAPAWGDAPEVREVEALTIDALRAADRSIYIEAQYLTSGLVRDLLAEKLRTARGPEIVILLTATSRGLMERTFMGRNRDRLVRKLQRLDRGGRLRVFHPVVEAPRGGCNVHIHAKLLIIDDRLLRVGSANLNNRSMGLDTELDLSIEARTPRERAAIDRVRNSLVAEHLGASTEAVASTVEREGSLIRAIDVLNTGPRGLKRLEVGRFGPTRPALGTRLFDPKRPFEPLWFLKRKPPAIRRSAQALDTP
jgi:phosphatidylserine/phosphatidylglycerophosphate/cardiolipin synthase-like enzyme